MIYIVIPVFNRWYFTNECLLSLRKQTYKKFKVIVVDHGSTDATSENIKTSFPEVILLQGNESMWWTAATNLGVSYALMHSPDYVLVLNNDLIVDEDYLDTLTANAELYPNSLIGSLSADIRNRDKVAYAGIKLNQYTAKYTSPVSINLPLSDFRKKYEIIVTDLLTGRGTLIPAAVFKKIGNFDERKFPHYLADQEFSLRARRNGYTLLISTKSVVYSHLTATGLNGKHTKKSLSYFKDLFFSIRSPNKLSNRWLWAKNMEIPLAYFAFDISRIVASKILKG